MNELKNAVSAIKKNPAMMLGIAGIGVFLFLITKGNKTQAPAMDNTPVTYNIYPSSGGVSGGTPIPAPIPTPIPPVWHAPPGTDPRDPPPPTFSPYDNTKPYEPSADDFKRIWSSMALTA